MKPLSGYTLSGKMERCISNKENQMDIVTLVVILCVFLVGYVMGKAS